MAGCGARLIRLQIEMTQGQCERLSLQTSFFNAIYVQCIGCLCCVEAVTLAFAQTLTPARDPASRKLHYISHHRLVRRLSPSPGVTRVTNNLITGFDTTAVNSPVYLIAFLFVQIRI